jgi:hypothetical protein
VVQRQVEGRDGHGRFIDSSNGNFENFSPTYPEYWDNEVMVLRQYPQTPPLRYSLSIAMLISYHSLVFDSRGKTLGEN